VAGEDLLRAVQPRFYPATAPQNFYRDRWKLLYALGWPALRREQCGLTCSPAHYRALIAERLENVAAHGDPARYGAYVPAYLLKCLQDYFQHHGDELYDELKHICNDIDQLLSSTRFAAQVRPDAQPIAVLASAHRLIAAQRSRGKPCNDRQLPLPLA